MKTKYFATIDQDDIIWGIGNSKEDSLNDAKHSIEDYREFNPLVNGDETFTLKTKECSEKCYNKVSGESFVEGRDSIYILRGKIEISENPITIDEFLKLSKKEKTRIVHSTKAYGNSLIRLSERYKEILKKE